MRFRRRLEFDCPPPSKSCLPGSLDETSTGSHGNLPRPIRRGLKFPQSRICPLPGIQTRQEASHYFLPSMLEHFKKTVVRPDEAHFFIDRQQRMVDGRKKFCGIRCYVTRHLSRPLADIDIRQRHERAPDRMVEGVV